MRSWTKVSRMAPSAIRKMQDQLLHAMLTEELARRHPHYRALFQERGLDPDRIKGRDDLAKLPFTEKADVLPRPDDRLRPKRFVLEPPGPEEKPHRGLFSFLRRKPRGRERADYKLRSLMFTAGRTGKALPIEYTRYDLDNLREAAVRFFDVLDLARDDTLVCAFTFAPGVHFWQMFHGTLAVGSTALHSGGGKVLGLEKILKAVNNLEADVLAAAPGYALFALQSLRHFQIEPEYLKRILIGIDYAPLEAAERLQRLMGAMKAAGTAVQRGYFLSEAKSGWAECALGHGYHTNPDHVLVEVVDPDTGAVVGEGEPGEIVITNLDARGTVFLRFKTGDITTGGLTTTPCPHCKRTVPRILGEIERKSLYFEFESAGGGKLLNGNRLKRAMFARNEVLLWYAELFRGATGDELKVVLKGLPGEDPDALCAKLAEELQAELEVPVTCVTSKLDAIIGKIGIERFVTEQTIFDNRERE